MSESLELRLKRLSVLTLDLKLGLKFFDLQIEPRDFGAEFHEVGAHRPRLLCWRRGVRMRDVKVRIRVAAVIGLSGLLRIRRIRRSRRRCIWLKSLSRRICEHGWWCKGIGQGARPRVLWWFLTASAG